MLANTLPDRPRPVLAVLTAALLAATSTAQQPAANLDQIRNGPVVAPIDPPDWVNGNAGPSNAHFAESLSTAYRAVMTDLPTDGTQITLVLEYDIKHSDRHALDYLTHFQRLEPHIFGHPSETIDPRIGVAAVSGSPLLGDDTTPIPAPSSAGSPVANQPTQSYLDLVASEGPDSVVMTAYNATFAAPIVYMSEGNLNASNSSSSIAVTFVANDPTVVLAWGGHIGTRNDWGFDPSGVPLSAGGISGSPYHMRLIDWNLGNLGNQDRSLKASAVIEPCPCDLTGPDGPVCPSSGPYQYCGPAGGSYAWTVTGDAAIVGPDDQQCVDVMPTAACDGSFTVSLTFDCGTGIPSTCEKTVVVDDDTPPSISCPGPITVECVGDVPPCDPNAATASDDCSVPVVTCSDGPLVGDGCGGTITRTFTATDACGNTASCTQTITVDDTTPPEITCPGPITVECVGDVPACDPSAATASDNCSVPVVSCSDGPLVGDGCGGTITRTFTATDDCGNTASCTQTITVDDTTPPMITCPGPISVQCIGDVPACDPNAATAVDNCSGAIVMCSDGPLVGGECGGTITRTFTAIDDCGNMASCTQTITVNDTIPPMITCPGPISVECIGDVPACDPTAATAVDNCSEAVITCSDGPLVGDECGGTITRTYTATDACGNADSCTQIITIDDTTPPSISCPGPITVECLGDVPPCDPTAATASDNCSVPDITCSDGPLVGDECGGTITRTYTATDACGNTDSCTQIITVDDTTPPTVNCPAGCTKIECRVPYFFTVTAGDNCDPDPVITASLTAVDPSLVVLTDLGGGAFTIELLTTTACGDVTVSCKATDACGNESDECTFEFECVDMACRLTAGGNASNSVSKAPGDEWSVGGQVGAPTLNQPTPCGEWTHRQRRGADGRFTFHAGTASAPNGTAILTVTCTDEGGCIPSGNPPSPAKDVDFTGIGSFKNVIEPGNGLFSQYAAQVVSGQTLHWFEVHTEDLGEPGAGGSQNPPGSLCPPDGTPSAPGDCSCPDFYSIRIYLKPEPPSATNPLIYEAFDYLSGGNFQTHAPVNGGTCGG